MAIAYYNDKATGHGVAGKVDDANNFWTTALCTIHFGSVPLSTDTVFLVAGCTVSSGTLASAITQLADAAISGTAVLSGAITAASGDTATFSGNPGPTLSGYVVDSGQSLTFSGGQITTQFNLTGSTVNAPTVLTSTTVAGYLSCTVNGGSLVCDGASIIVSGGTIAGVSVTGSSYFNVNGGTINSGSFGANANINGGTVNDGTFSAVLNISGGTVNNITCTPTCSAYLDGGTITGGLFECPTINNGITAISSTSNPTIFSGAYYNDNAAGGTVYNGPITFNNYNGSASTAAFPAASGSGGMFTFNGTTIFGGGFLNFPPSDYTYEFNGPWSFDDGATWNYPPSASTDPGMAYVAEGTEYMINNTAFTGTMPTIAVNNGSMIASPTVTPSVSTPELYSFRDSVTVTLSASPALTTIFYSLDGSNPLGGTGRVYSEPLVITTSLRLAVIGIYNGNISPVVYYNYVRKLG